MGRLLREVLLVIGLQGTLQVPAGALPSSTGPANSLQQRALHWVGRCACPSWPPHCLGRAMTSMVAELHRRLGGIACENSCTSGQHAAAMRRQRCQATALTHVCKEWAAQACAGSPEVEVLNRWAQGVGYPSMCRQRWGVAEARRVPLLLRGSSSAETQLLTIVCQCSDGCPEQ